MFYNHKTHSKRQLLFTSPHDIISQKTYI